MLPMSRDIKTVGTEETINRVKFRHNKTGSPELSGDQNPGQWPVLRPYVAASNEPENPPATLQLSYVAQKYKS